MNKINLTDEQKNKLLQMCNDLFPEYDIAEYFDNTECCFFLKDGDETCIHWFELCVIEIPERIAEGLNTVYPKDNHAFIIDMLMKKMLNFSALKKEHPVDYLYKMYEKTLENEK
jgi:hypothetical protein